MRLFRRHGMGTRGTPPLRSAWLWAACLGVLAACCQAAVSRFDPTDSAAVPKLLSQTGVYADLGTKAADTSLKYFEINAPLWSDGAAKQRWISLPPGKTLVYHDSSDLFAYPDSTIFVKNFLLDRIEGDASTRVLWETRLLVNRKNDQGFNVWYGFSYKWNEASTEAQLVSAQNGFDTLFPYFPRGPANPQSYKKWRFPSQQECNTCHVPSSQEAGVPHARNILGFFPAQLKRQAPHNPSVNQIAALFSAGIFTGNAPTTGQLAARWKSVHEPIPTGLSAAERFRIVDTMARSYIAGNCSGCHGNRGLANSSGVPAHLNFDFTNIVPLAEFGFLQTDGIGLDDPQPSSTAGGRGYFLDAVRLAGFDTAAGGTWDMALPHPAQGPPALLYPGYPSMSTLLYRQMVRRTPWRDSAETRKSIAGEDPEGWGAWIFAHPWGSEGWRTVLAQHNVPVSAVIAHTRDGGSSGGQMPPVAASFQPDTAALRILAEWIKTYSTLHVVDSTRIITGTLRTRSTMPGKVLVQGRVIHLPAEWQESRASQSKTFAVSLTSMQGRTTKLHHMGHGRYAVPTPLPRGIYALMAGRHTTRIIVAD